MSSIAWTLIWVGIFVGGVIGGVMVPDSTTGMGLIAVQLSVFVGAIVGIFIGLSLGLAYDQWRLNRNLEGSKLDIPFLIDMQNVVISLQKKMTERDTSNKDTE